MLNWQMAERESAEHLISKVVNSVVFFEEFVFAKNKFKSAPGVELELADAVVALDDVLLVMQIKERSDGIASTPEIEQKWFQRKVVGAATRQIRDTLRYLAEHNEIKLTNEDGRIFDLAAGKYSEVIRFVLYQASDNLPESCRLKKFHRSAEGGFIHILDVEDYLKIAQLLRVPEDIIRYFRYRELMLTKFESECASLPEASLAGGYIGDGDDKPPQFESFSNLHRMVLDDETWDISRHLRTLRDHTSDPKYHDDYYEIMREFVRLPRSMWRVFKERFDLCIKNAQQDKFALPYRGAFPDRSIGFMLFSPDSGYTKRDDWGENRIKGLINFTSLQKFDQKLEKCIGVQVAKDGQEFDIQWCMITGEWVDDPDLRAKLKVSSPFRPVSEKQQFSYFLHDQQKI